MVEQIRISPEEVRGYGNVCEEHSLEDFTVNVSSLSKVSETVHGALTNTYKLLYSVYGLMFDFDKGAKQLYLQTNEANTLSLGFDAMNKQLYLVDEDDTGLWLVFDEDTHEVYITDEAPPSISISASSPYLLSGETTDLIVTLYDGVGAPLANKSVTVSDGTSVYNGITNNNGLFTLFDVEVSEDTTFTATYSSVSATCKVEYCLFVDYALTSKHNDNYDNLSYLTRSDAYTIASNTSGSSKLLPTKVSSNTLYVSSTDYEVCITILEVSGSDNRIRLTSDASSSSYWDFTLTQNTVGQYRFVYDGTNHAIKRYKNGILENTIEKTLGSNKGCTLRIANNASFKYCDLRVKAL